jgi:hypothetical protein
MGANVLPQRPGQAEPDPEAGGEEEAGERASTVEEEATRRSGGVGAGQPSAGAMHAGPSFRGELTAAARSGPRSRNLTRKGGEEAIHAHARN